MLGIIIIDFSIQQSGTQDRNSSWDIFPGQFECWKFV